MIRPESVEVDEIELAPRDRTMARRRVDVPAPVGPPRADKAHVVARPGQKAKKKKTQPSAPPKKSDDWYRTLQRYSVTFLTFVGLLYAALAVYEAVGFRLLTHMGYLRAVCESIAP